VEIASKYFTIFYLFFVLATMMPLILEIGIEMGLRATCRNLVSSLVRFNPIFAAFQSKLLGHYFMNTVYYGGAQYMPTGRGLATAKEGFAKLYRCFAASHINDGFEAALFLMFSVGIYYSGTFYACMVVATCSWTLAPFVFNPRQFDRPSEMCRDLGAWVRWLCCGSGSEEESWTSWAVRLQESRKTASRRWVVLPSGRLLAVVCTLALALEVDPLPPFAPTLEWFQTLWMLMPPLWHAGLCLVLGMACSLGVEVPPDNSYALLAVVALLVTAAEGCFIEWGRIFEDNTMPVLLFHKYICTRFLLEVADNIAVHQPGGRMASFMHASCRLWALSLRWLRDLLVGLLLASLLLVLSMLPGLGRLHACFLFRTCRCAEASELERLPSFAQSDSSAMLSGQAETQLLGFIQGFSPQVSSSA